MLKSVRGRLRVCFRSGEDSIFSGRHIHYTGLVPKAPVHVWTGGEMLHAVAVAGAGLAGGQTIAAASGSMTISFGAR